MLCCCRSYTRFFARFQKLPPGEIYIRQHIKRDSKCTFNDFEVALATRKYAWWFNTEPEEHVHRIVCCCYCCCCCTIFIAFFISFSSYSSWIMKHGQEDARIGSFSCYQLIYILMLLLLLQRKCMHKIRFIHCNCNNLFLHSRSTCISLSLVFCSFFADENCFCWPCHSSGDNINIWLFRDLLHPTNIYFFSSLLFILVVNLCLVLILICTCFPHSCHYFGQFKCIYK